MQYQPLVKSIKKAIANNDIAQLLELTSMDWMMIYLYTDKIFQNSYTVEKDYWGLYDDEGILNLDFSLKQSSISCLIHSNGGEFQYSTELSHELGLGDSLMWPLVFCRTAYKDGKLSDHYELLQNFVHAIGMFFNNKNGTYTLINEDGDIEVKAVTIFEPSFELVLFERKALDYYLGYSKHFLVRFFELKELGEQQKWKIDNLNTPNRKRRVYHYEEIPWCKGAEIIQPIYTVEQIEQGNQKKYESFIILDFKHKQIAECSCAPDMLDNYYKDTGKPFGASPAFFDPEVLSEYKNNHERYEVTERGIYCYGAWSLRPYSINEEGQVHAYIYGLGQLPHKEQLHWKKYNKEPKAGISKVAYNTDFLAEFDETKCPLRTIKQYFANFPAYIVNNEKFILWNPKGGDIDVLFNQIHPVITDIKKDYKDYLLNLCILIIDGLDEKTIRHLVSADTEEKTLVCLEMLLNKWRSKNTDTILKAIRKLQRERSKHGGHGGGVIDFDIKEAALNLTQELSEAVALLIDEITKNSTSAI